MQNIADQISNQCSGILWVTNGPLDLSLPSIYSLNYLLDGLLIQRLKQEFSTLSEKGHFFLSENFGRPFFIAHLKENADLLKDIEDHLKIVLPLLPAETEIYLMHQGTQHKNLLNQLQNNHPQITFKSI